jgi:hypothetical protein
MGYHTWDIRSGVGYRGWDAVGGINGMGFRVKDTMGGIHGMRCKGCDIEDTFRERNTVSGVQGVGYM